MADDFKTTDVGQRYARALFDLAKDERSLPAVEKDLKSVKAAIRESADLRALVG
ncbi:MAG: F0F1 ATP synthase subunit delta, partial [Caulobacteraceae bacterium]